KTIEKEFRDVLKWLNVVDPGANYSSALAVGELGMGIWLLEGPDYMKWEEDKGEVLYLYGIHDATVIEYIKHLCSVSQDHAFAYFYFTFSDMEKQNVLNMLLSIIGQLLQGLSGQGLPNGVTNLYHNSKAIGKLPDIKALQTMFSEIIKLSKKTFIILDALDEFPKST
ncbi:hypothetical protein C7212DRAFT_205819, partial [Tuber magnatum]